ncbi:MAG: translesion error-prone DNA polymerase V autoproteolytic subunit [Candidatus Omnitrophota bacterium]
MEDIPLAASAPVKIPLFVSRASAGFPSPADDFIDTALDLNEHLIRHPAATFFVKAKGDSMIRAGIFPGSLLMVDRSLEPRQGSIILAVLDGAFTVKRFHQEGGCVVLMPENPKYQPIHVGLEQDFSVWGVVIHAIRTFT